MANNKSALTGTMITAGTAIGAGMFSLPVVSSGMWIGLTLVFLLLFWQLNYLSSLYILEANFKFEPGASFDTIVKSILGKNWSIAAGVAIALLMYVILYAYFSALGGTADAYLADFGFSFSNQKGLSSLLIGGVLATMVALSTRLVGKISTILVLGMVLAFLASMFGLTPYIEIENILNHNVNSTKDYTQYIWAALPYFLTSFCFATVVPSLYKYYGKDKKVIKKSLFNGSLIALIGYTLFLVVSFGNISRFEFIAINDAGGSMATIVNAMTNGVGNELIEISLAFFANLAIITSFLGVGLGLFDYIADKFKISNTVNGRVITGLITFGAPATLSFFFPNGFIQAIGFAGLISVFGFFVIPFVFIRKLRSLDINTGYMVPGKNRLLVSFLSVSVVVAVCHVLNMMGQLPTW